MAEWEDCECIRCGQQFEGEETWIMWIHQGDIVGFVCPECQTPEENAEVEMDEATTEYLPPQLDGKIRWRRKGFED